MCLPVPTVEAGAPFNKEFCKLLFVGKMVLVGNPAGTGARNVLVTKGSGTDLIADRGWLGLGR